MATTIHIPADYSTIQAGIDAAADGDTVLVAEGTYFENGVDFLGKAILVTSTDPEDSLVVENTVVDGNSLDSVFYFHSLEDSTSILRGLTIRNGWSDDFGGGVYCIHSSPAIRNCRIKENTAASKGGGIYGLDTSLILESCSISNNSALVDGGGFACYASQPSIIACRIENNAASDDGGGVFIKDDSSLSIINSTINCNSAWGDGGGVFTLSSNPLFVSCLIKDNSSGGYGGGVYCRTSESSFLDCELTSNDAIKSGGGLFCLQSEIEINTCNFFKNLADSGGSISLWDSTAEIIGTMIYGSFAFGADGGGGVLCLDSSPQFFGCTIRKNTAFDDGGGILASVDSSHQIRNCTISTNISYENGGGICFRDNISPVIEGCSIVMNTAGDYGGGIYAAGGSSATLSNCTVAWNSADLGGGGIYCFYSSPNISRCYISRNQTEYNGGGIHCKGSDPHISNCSIDGNATDISQGGGIGCYDSSPTIFNCTITGNTSKNYGGGFYCLYSSPIVTNCILWGNLPHEMNFFSGNPIITYSDIEGGWEDEGNIDIDPRFFDPQNDDFHLRNDSPCIDAGIDCGIQEDIDGESRPQGSDFDMGSDEVRLEGPVVHISPRSFLAIGELGEHMEADILKVYSIGSDPIEYSIFSEETTWLSLEGELSGMISPGESIAIFLEYDVSCIQTGIHSDTITVLSNDPWLPVGKIPIRLEICPIGVIHVPADCSTIQEAINFAMDGETVLVADGTYAGRGNRNLDFSGKSITIMSENGASHTIIDCGHGARGFNFHTGEGPGSVLTGFTILNGYPEEGKGGGIFCSKSSPTIKECTIVSNIADDCGGGIYCTDSSPTINRCTIISNKADVYGGGIYCDNSSPAITRCVLGANISDNLGGGIFCRFESSPSITNCIVQGNNANSGGGIYCIHSSPLISNSSISDNSVCDYGGGLYCRYLASPMIVNCTITRNCADYGGGAYCTNSSLQFINCTFNKNAAPFGGSGVRFRSSPNVEIINCILWDDADQEIYATSCSLLVTYSDIEGGWPGEGNIDANPHFISYMGFDCLLRPSSPCIDAGDPAIEDALYDWHPLCPDWYVNGIRSDMGAYGGPGNIDWFR